MLTTSCPKCEKEVTVPSGATGESRVRCPLCSEEYTLEHVFSDLPPLLELLDAPSTNGLHAAAGAAVADDAAVAEPASGEPGGMFDFDKPAGAAGDDTADEEGGIGLADAEQTVPASSGFDFGESSAPATSGGGTTTSLKSRPRKKSASPVKAIIGVIIGGLFAIPIAQLTLWYLPGGWRIEQRDPMEIGQKLSGTFMSFIVPSWVSNPDGEGGDNNGGDPTVTPASSANNSDGASSDGTAPSADGEESSGLGEMLGSAHNKNRGNNNRGNGNGNNRGNNNANNGNGNENNGNGNNSQPADGAADGNSSSDGEEPAAAPASPVDGAPTYTASDLADQLKNAREQVDRFDDVTNPQVEPAQRLAIRDDYFAAIAKLAEVTTFASERPEGHLEHVYQMLQKSASTSKKRRIIGVSAMSIIKDEARESGGIILPGKVAEINKRGQLYEAVITVDTADSPPVSVYGKEDPSAAFKVGDTVMILGVIVDKPVDKITGYKGPRDDPVVWGGYSVVVPTDNEE